MLKPIITLPAVLPVISFRARRADDEARVKRAFWPKLRRLAGRLPFADDLVAAYFCAFDRDTPAKVKAALFAALAYFVLPSDMIADILPAVGFADDAAVLAAVINLVANHIRPEHYAAARRVLDDETPPQ